MTQYLRSLVYVLAASVWLGGLTFYALTKDGRYAGACAYEGTDYAICDEKGPRLEKCAYLFKASEQPRRG